MEYYSAINKEWNFAIWSNMDGLGEHYAKWSKSDRERQILYDFTYMWNLKNNKWANITRQKQTYRYREQKGGCHRGGEKRNRWGRLKGTNFQFQNKWITGMKCIV